MILNREQIDEFREVIKPVMKYLINPKVFHPHVKIIIENGHAEIVEGLASDNNDEFIGD